VNRREFLRYSLWSGAALFLSSRGIEAGDELSIDESLRVLRQFQVVDCHAHFYTTSDLKAFRDTGLTGTVASALGDGVYRSGGRATGTEHSNTMRQLEPFLSALRSGVARPVLKGSQVPAAVAEPGFPGIILSIEGGDPLEGKPESLEEFHRLGVRLITLLHYRINEIGDTMTSPPRYNGLTPAGRKIVERMQSLGMVVDVAHAHKATLKDIVSITARPVIDSHTGPCDVSAVSRCLARLRSWEEMELVAKTGGMVGSWPLAFGPKKTFHDWAVELMEMRKRIGIEHIGIGTDDGGRLPATVKGYKDVRSLGNLVNALSDVGFSTSDIAAVLGGNFLRVLKACLG